MQQGVLPADKAAQIVQQAKVKAKAATEQAAAAEGDGGSFRADGQPVRVFAAGEVGFEPGRRWRSLPGSGRRAVAGCR